MEEDGHHQCYKPLQHDEVRSRLEFAQDYILPIIHLFSFKELLHVLRPSHSKRSFSGWLTIAQLTGAPLRYQQHQNHLKPLFPHPPPSYCHQNLLQLSVNPQENQVVKC